MKTLWIFTILAAGISIMLVGYQGLLRGKWSIKRTFLYYIVGNGVDMIDPIFVYPHRPMAIVLTLLEALMIWAWWNSGGGDDAKRRARALKRKFIAVRRTAPVTA